MLCSEPRYRPFHRSRERQAEIKNLDGLPIALDQDVLGLEIAVNDGMQVQIVQTVEDAQHNARGFLLRDHAACADIVEEIAFSDVLEDEGERDTVAECSVEGLCGVGGGYLCRNTSDECSRNEIINIPRSRVTLEGP